jgi:hypothetical protein
VVTGESKLALQTTNKLGRSLALTGLYKRLSDRLIVGTRSHIPQLPQNFYVAVLVRNPNGVTPKTA